MPCRPAEAPQDVHLRQLRGNLPQAFVPALLFECGGALGYEADASAER
jgi:hypothetical protein